MPDRSSTSNSDLDPGVAVEPVHTCLPHRPNLLGDRARIPSAFIIAIVLAMMFHLVAWLVHPQPVARACLRQKAARLMAERRPTFIIAGDSRSECGIEPRLLAAGLGVPAERVANISEAACDTPAVLSAYREFAGQLGPRPTMVLHVSFFGVNDGARGIVGDELLWRLDARDRLRLAGVSRTFSAWFLPEKAIWQDVMAFWPDGADGYAAAGFESQPGCINTRQWSPTYTRKRANSLAQWWYSGVSIEGIRWRQLCEDLRTLHDDGVNLIVVLMPLHPDFLRLQTPAAQVEREFRQHVCALCASLGVACLSYDADCLQPGSPDLLFHDLLHLNRDGAAIFTARLARDIRGRLQSADRFNPSGSAMACVPKPASVR